MAWLSVDLQGRRFADLVVPLFVTALLLAPTVVIAGQVGIGSASIIGQVKDESGAVLPGVTVTTTSPALQMPQISTVTDERGEYRLTPLPIGGYVVEYTLSGFQALRVEDVRLTVGFVAKLDQVLKIGALAETIMVSGASPLIDPTSAATRTTLTAESMALIPSGRNGMGSFLAQVPGVRSNVDVGGSTMGDNAAFKAYGQNGSAWHVFEGVLAGTTNSASGSHYDFYAIDGARVQTIGNEAEMPRRGVLINLVSKSGGNEFHGELMWDQTGDNLQSSNIDAAQRAQGVVGATKLYRRWDGAGQLGGKIIENRLWFFTSIRHRLNESELLGALYPDGSPVEYLSWQLFRVYKGSYQITPNSKLIAFWHTVAAPDGPRGASQFVPPESRDRPSGRYRTRKVEWQAVRGNGLVMSVQYGKWNWNSLNQGYAPGVPASMDIATLKVGGDHLQDGVISDYYQHHTRGVATLYKPDLFAGNHEFKLGVDHLLQTAAPQRPARRSGDYQLLFNNGAPFQINVFNSPVTPTTKSTYVGIYVQDAWTVGRRLTLNLGLRGAHDNGYVPEQCRAAGTFFPAECYPKVQPNVWNTAAPRVHAVYDPGGDGLTVIKGGWGRFIHLREAGGYETTHLNPNAARTSTYRWNDRNGNRDYDPGEVNLDPNGTDFVSFGNLVQGIVNPNEQIPTTDEYSLAFERQVGYLAVRIATLYAKNRHVNRFLTPSLPYDVYNIPITNRDPGRDGILDTADDPGTTITYYDYPAAFRGAQFQTIQLVNDDPKNDTSYKTIEVAATRRLAQNWQLSGSYSATRSNVPFGDASTGALALNPNAEINVSDNNWIWIGKVSGSYLFPKGILGSANYDLRSGDPLARQVLFRGGSSIPSIVLNVEPIGNTRLPAVKILDLRAGKQFTLGPRRRLEVHVDCLNALNVNVPLAVSVRAGSSFLVPTGGLSGSAIVRPRILQIGARFIF